MTKKVALCLTIQLFAITALFGQESKQEYLQKELSDAFGGLLDYSNYPKARGVYTQLTNYSGKRFTVFFLQQFRWGSAHNGGVIFLDYSSINKQIDILAFIFAHEWAHQDRGHVPNIYLPQGGRLQFSEQREFEDDADVYAGEFLAQFNYDIKVVYDYLSNLPETEDKTHSSGRQRANLVLQGFKEGQVRRLSKYSPELQKCLLSKIEDCISTCTAIYKQDNFICENISCLTSESNLKVWLPQCENDIQGSKMESTSIERCSKFETLVNSNLATLTEKLITERSGIQRFSSRLIFNRTKETSITLSKGFQMFRCTIARNSDQEKVEKLLKKWEVDLDNCIGPGFEKSKRQDSDMTDVIEYSRGSERVMLEKSTYKTGTVEVTFFYQQKP